MEWSLAQPGFLLGVQTMNRTDRPQKEDIPTPSTLHGCFPSRLNERMQCPEGSSALAVKRFGVQQDVAITHSMQAHGLKGKLFVIHGLSDGRAQPWGALGISHSMLDLQRCFICFLCENRNLPILLLKHCAILQQNPGGKAAFG